MLEEKQNNHTAQENTTIKRKRPAEQLHDNRRLRRKKGTETIQHQIIRYAHCPGNRDAIGPNNGIALHCPYVGCMRGVSTHSKIDQHSNGNLRRSLEEIKEERPEKQRAMSRQKRGALPVFFHDSGKLFLLFPFIAKQVQFSKKVKNTPADALQQILAFQKKKKEQRIQRQTEKNVETNSATETTEVIPENAENKN